MSKPVITVENLSKAYRIGLKEEIPDTLVAAMSGLMKAPFRKFRDLRKLDTFGQAGGEEEDLYWALKDVSFEVQEKDSPASPRVGRCSLERSGMVVRR